MSDAAKERRSACMRTDAHLARIAQKECMIAIYLPRAWLIITVKVLRDTQILIALLATVSLLPLLLPRRRDSLLLALLLPVTSRQDLTSTLRIFLCRQASQSPSTLIPIFCLRYHYSLHCCRHNVFRAADGHRTLLSNPGGSANQSSSPRFPVSSHHTRASSFSLFHPS